MLCYSIHSGLHTPRLVFGLLVIILIWIYLSPEGHGWTFDKTSNSWIPVWTTILVASKACSELVKCGCIKRMWEQGVHVRRKTGNVQNNVAATVINS